MNDFVALLAILQLLLWIIGVIAAPFFAYTLYRSLKLTQQHHTAMPGFAWLLVIPVIHYFWIFYIITVVGRGITGRYKEMRLDCGDAGTSLGYRYAVLSWIEILGIIFGRNENEMWILFVVLFGPLALWAFISYWLKIRGYNNELEEASQHQNLPAADGIPESVKDAHS